MGQQQDDTPRYADGTEVPSTIDESTRRSSIGMDPQSGIGNGDPNSDDPTTAANAPGAVQDRPAEGE